MSAILLVALMVAMCMSPSASADEAGQTQPETPLLNTDYVAPVEEIEAISVEEVPGGTIYWQSFSEEPAQLAAAITRDTLASPGNPGSYIFVPSNPSPMAPVANVLVYTDDWVHTSPNTLVQQALALYGLGATVYVDGDYAGFETALTTGGPWDLVIWSAENYNPAGHFAPIQNYLQGGGKVIATCWQQNAYPGDPLWAEMGFTYVSNYVAPPPCYWWQTGHDIFNSPEAAPQWLTRVQNSGNSQGTRIEPTADGYAVAGYTMAPAPNEAAIVIRNDNKAIYKGIRDVSTNADDDTDGVLDGVELWVNMMDFILTAGGTGGLDNILVYADDAFHTAPNTFVDQALDYLGLPYTAHYDGDFAGFTTDLTTNGPWDLVIFGHENYGTGSAVFDALNTYASGGGKLIANTWQMSGHPLWSAMGVTYTSNDASPPDPVYWWDPAHEYFNSPMSVPQLIFPTAVGYGTYACKAEPLPGNTAVAGHVPAAAFGEAAIVPANGGDTIFKSFLDGQFDQDDDIDGTADGIELWINLIASMQVFVDYPTNVAIFETTDPWGYDSIQQVYDSHGIPYTIFGEADIGTANLAPYDKIILVMGDGQDQSFLDAIGANTAWFEGWVDDGAHMNVHVAPYSSLTISGLPFGLESVQNPDDTVDIAIPGYPLLTFPNDITDDELDGWNSAYHRYFTDWPENANVVLTEGDTGGDRPVLLDFQWGSGRVIATGQTVEWAWGHAYSNLLENILVENEGHGVLLTPETYYVAENTGTTVPYSFTVQNTGMWPDTYDITKSGSAWTTSIWDATGSFQITETGLMAPGEAMDFTVMVDIPAGLAPGITDSVTITVTSQGFAGAKDTSQITTESDPWYWFEVAPDTQTNFGAKGEWVEHRVKITNLGSRTDNYLPMFYEDVAPAVDADWWTKFHTVDLRPIGIYNGIDDGSETWWWGPVQPGETKEYAIKVFVPTDEIGAFDQAQISITSDADANVQRWTEIWTRNSMPQPFYDDFERAGDVGVFGLYNDGGFLGDIYGAWKRSDDGLVGVNDWTAYSGTYSMFTSGGAVTATSCKINMEIESGIASCVIRRGDGAFSENPDWGEDLVVEYSDGNLQWAQWHELGTFYGGETPGEVFTPVWTLPPDALNPRFQLRFRQTAGSGTGYDYWHIDDVYVGPGSSAFQLTPDYQEMMGGPGGTVTYTFQIENFAVHSDIYTIAAAGNSWPVDVPMNVGPIAPGGTGIFTVDVQIPTEAGGAAFDDAEITATSDICTWASDNAFIHTYTGTVWNVDLDLWYGNIQPAVNEADPGNTIMVFPQTYVETVVVNKPLIIQGVDMATTVVDGNGGAGGTAAPDILILHADDGNGEPLRTQLQTLGGLGTVDEYDSRASTPTLGDLLAYDAVVTWSNYNYGDSTAIGNVLADYVDAGGRVIDMEFSLHPSWGMAGRFVTEQYTAMDNVDCSYSWANLGPFDPAHPIMNGVSAAADIYREYGTALTPGSSAVAMWSDGELFVAAKDDRSVVSINAYPGMYRQWTGNVDLIIHNSIMWLTRGGAAVFDIRADGVSIWGLTIQNHNIGILMDNADSCSIVGNDIRCANGIRTLDSGYNMIVGNSIVSSSAMAGLQTIISEDFETAFPPGGWGTAVYGGTDDWTRNDAAGRPNYAGGSGFCADADSDAWGPGTSMDTGLRAPTFSLVNAISAQLDFDHSYNDIGGADFAEVRVSTDGAATWTQIALYNEDHSPTGPGEHVTLSLAPFLGQPNVIVEFHYDDDTWDWWWEIDNVVIQAEFPGTGIEIDGWEYSSQMTDDFSSHTGQWTYYGNAAMTGDYCRLTQNSNGLTGQVLLGEQISSSFTAEFDYLAGGGSGADGMAMNFFKETYTPAGGGYLGSVDGDGTALGYSVEFDNYDNGVGWDPNANHISINRNTCQNHLAWAADGRTEDNTWHHVKVIATATDITVFVDNMDTALLSWSGAVDMTYGGFSFSAGTGGLNNNHFVDNVVIKWGPPLPNMIALNVIQGFATGVNLQDAGTDCMVFWNDFVDNVLQASDDTGNVWDMGYPNGGNYWSDYAGTDAFGGPLQTTPGSDGIGDTPYSAIAGGSGAQDNYPLMAPIYMLSAPHPINTWNDIPTADSALGDPVTIPEEAPEEDPAASVTEPETETSGAMDPAEAPAVDGAVDSVAEAEEVTADIAAEPDATTQAEPAATADARADEPAGTGNMPALLALAAVALIASGILAYRRRR